MDTQVFQLTTFDSTTSAMFLSMLLGVALVLLLLKVKPLPKGAKYAASGMIIAVLGLLSWVFYKAHDASIRLSPTTMLVDIPLYRVELSRESLLTSEAKILNLDEDGAPKLSYRSNGVGMPGYSLGWFKLAEASESVASEHIVSEHIASENIASALLSVTHRERVLVLPTTEGYLLILSLEQPEALLASLLTPTL
ncbi:MULTISPECIES: hypothetical protein [Shewanella]|uniref:hypothetical protein n=1 Tax=Shewanella TaxID=22 RepID=UPI001EFDF1FA|nr:MULTISPECIES: hypothetical protein [Shewanella]MCG9748219.1 hypothetical protein [Shewanella sp. Isolate8]MCL2911419.1 hypothetical protein [Shewanella aquimarina]